MGSNNPEGFGENADEEGRVRRQAEYDAHRREVYARERPFYSANNILGSIGHQRESQGVVKRQYSRAGIQIEDRHVLPRAHGDHTEEYDIKIYFKQGFFAMPQLKYHAQLGISSKLLVFDKDPEWIKVLEDLANQPGVKRQSVPCTVGHWIG
jgi:hypothetical protein